MIRMTCDGFDLWMTFDPKDEDDCEILKEAYALMLRRAKSAHPTDSSQGDQK